jgi:cell filamentation protein
MIPATILARPFSKTFSTFEIKTRAKPLGSKGSTLRAEESLPECEFDSVHSCSVHHPLFQDASDWAGRYRTARTFKGGNAFCSPENIPAQMDALLQGLHGGSDLCRAQLECISSGCPLDFLANSTQFTPSVKGHGRSQMALIGLIGAAFGHPLALERLNRTRFLPAMIASYFGNREPLIVE